MLAARFTFTTSRLLRSATRASRWENTLINIRSTSPGPRLSGREGRPSDGECPHSYAAGQYNSLSILPDPQTVGDVNSGIANVAGLRAALPGIGRLYKRLPLVRRGVPLPFRLRRGPHALLHAAATGAVAAGAGSARGDHRSERPLLRRVADLPTSRPPLDIPAPSEEHLLRDGDNRRQRSDMLTQRQFCALRRGRPGHHRVTIAVVVVHVGPDSGLGPP